MYSKNFASLTVATLVLLHLSSCNFNFEGANYNLAIECFDIFTNMEIVNDNETLAKNL
jgi:hypothetical protein